MAFHEGIALPWSCFFGPYDGRVPNDIASADARAGNGCRTLRGRRVYCGFNRHYRNYAHWITQCVPAIAGYATEPGFKDGILLLPPLPARYERALALAGIPLPEIALADPDRAISVDEFVYSTLLCYHYAPSCLAHRVFAQMIASACGEAHACASDLPRRIFVSRADSAARPMRNEAELSVRLAELGIVTITPGAMPLEDQIRHFHAARLVVGPHGAGLANIVFCLPGSVMYELMPEHWTDSFVGPSINLFAQTAGMNYCMDTHRVHGTWASHGHDVPWTVDITATIDRAADLIKAYGC